MPNIINGLEFIKDQIKGEIIDMDNPNCNECNECCSMGTMLTDEEYEFLKKFIKKDKGKKLYEEGVQRILKYYKKGIMYWICPFSNYYKKCTIYNIRPIICRQFHCNDNLRSNEYDKNKYPDKHKTIFDLFKNHIRRS